MCNALLLQKHTSPCFLCSFWDANLPCEQRQSHQQPPAGHHQCVVSQSGYHCQTPRDQLQNPSCVESTSQWLLKELLSATTAVCEPCAACEGGWFTRLQKLLLQKTLLPTRWGGQHSIPALHWKAGSVLLKIWVTSNKVFQELKKEQTKQFPFERERVSTKKVTPKSFSLLENTVYNYTRH